MMHDTESPFRTLVTLGESTTAGGWSSCRDRCWASVLAALINEFQDQPVRLVNSGIGANLISTRSPAYEYSGKPAASERLDKHVIAHRPDLVVISYGLNDVRGGTPLEMFREELVKIILYIGKECNAVIVLLNVYYTDLSRSKETSDPIFNKATPELLTRYNQTIQQVARDTDCLFTDVYGAYEGCNWAVHYDGIHANDLGHRLIANRIFETLVRNCPGLSLRTKAMERSIPPWRDESTLAADYGYKLEKPSRPK